MDKTAVLHKFPVVAVVGPTATGKTAVSIRLAKRLGGEIVNLDSIQIYKGLDIGSAKPSREEMSGIVHHLIDIREPWEVMDAASFMRIASRMVDVVLERGKVPILVGGTGFYLKSLEQGLSVLPGAMPGLRSRLIEMIRDKGHQQVHSLLVSLDPQMAKKIHPKDTYRLFRAFEILMGCPASKDARVKEESFPTLMQKGIRIFKIGLMCQRDLLYRRIDDRVEQMLENGLVKEVKGLLAQGLNPSLKPLQSIGYRHIISYLLKKMEFSQAIFEMKRDTRRYAKRQITWFKKDPGIRWFNPESLLQEADIWKAVN